VGPRARLEKNLSLAGNRTPAVHPRYAIYSKISDYESPSFWYTALFL
jgi:hypothetical protein